ncbi:MAG: hypothetical protein NVS2B16_10930 [Chloroflexota bacterium]
MQSVRQSIWQTSKYMIILAYHRITPAIRGPLSVTTSDFRRQLEYLLERGYHNVSLHDLAERNANPRTLKRAFAVTMDDGYRDNYLHAMPVLHDLRLRATLFVTVNFIQTDTLYPWDRDQIAGWGGARDEDYSVTWDHIQEMLAGGTFDIGSHTLTHPELGVTSPDTARYEISISKSVLEQQLGRRVRIFCYPRGNLNRKVVRMVHDAGYDFGVVTPPRPVPLSRYTLPRIGLYANTDFTTFKRKTSTAYQTLLRMGLLPYVQIVRRKQIDLASRRAKRCA